MAAKGTKQTPNICQQQQDKNQKKIKNQSKAKQIMYAKLGNCVCSLGLGVVMLPAFAHLGQTRANTKNSLEIYCVSWHFADHI